jgi:hypothetical protein
MHARGEEMSKPLIVLGALPQFDVTACSAIGDAEPRALLVSDQTISC